MATIQAFRATLPDLDKIDDTDTFFDEVKECYPLFYKQGFFNSLTEKTLVVYRLRNDRRTFTGLLACTDIKDYLKGKIIRHELTLEEKEKKMARLVKERQAMIKPTMLTYPKVTAISDLLAQCIKDYPAGYQLNYKETEHSFHFVTKEKDINKFVQLFETHVPKSYIADGHHRFATTANLYKENNAHRFQLTGFFSADQLEIHEFNRIVETLNNYSPKGFKAELRKFFIIKKLQAPRKSEEPHEIIMHLNQKWYALMLKESELIKISEASPSEKLDVSLLNRVVLHRVLGIKNVRSDTRVKYLEGIKGLEEVRRKVSKSQHRVGFILHPIEMKEFMSVSDAGEILPPKSTFFAPRMRNGLIVHQF